ncbi:MAG TPA: hypothetical protein VIC55_08480 [Gemmatimonadaceae bacterium]|jgi:hypothetical protein
MGVGRGVGVSRAGGTAGAAAGVLTRGCLGTLGGVNSGDDRRGEITDPDWTGVLGRVVRGAKKGGSAVLRRGGFWTSSG